MLAYLRYLAGRLTLWALTIFVSVTIVFFVPRLVPGDPMTVLFAKLSSVAGRMGSSDLIEQYKHYFGLDQSLWVQYTSFLRELTRGNLGYSITSFPSEVGLLLRSALPWTIGLLTVTTLLSWVLGSVVGAVVGWRGRKSPFFQALVPVALVLYTTPYYILALILVFVFAFLLPIFPLSGAYSVGLQPAPTPRFALDVLHHSMLPALSIILVSLGWWFLSMRSLITGLRGEDYIVLAQAKGLTDRRIMWHYAFRNALLPQMTGLALSLGQVVGGALITEVIFAYPGVGWLIFNSIRGLDFPVIQGSVLMVTVAVATANLAIDLLYPVLDPRIRQAGRG
jgi:peptide/nickel transport system permease protein